MKADQAKRLGERIELALQADPEAVRNTCEAIEHSARSLSDDPGSVALAASMFIISDAINEAVQ